MTVSKTESSTQKFESKQLDTSSADCVKKWKGSLKKMIDFDMVRVEGPEVVSRK